MVLFKLSFLQYFFFLSIFTSYAFTSLCNFLSLPMSVIILHYIIFNFDFDIYDSAVKSSYVIK